MRWIRIGALVIVLAAPFVIGATAARHELRADFRPDRSVPVRPPVLAEEQLEDVAFEAAGNAIRGWFVPSSNGAAVVLAHGTDADRTQLATEAHLLARHGYGVLAFDWPGHGQSGGRVTWDEAERAALREAVEFTSRAPGVDAERVGVFAFSRGTMMAVQVAAREPRVAALVLEGAFADADDELRHQFRHWGVISQWPALWTARWLGMKPDELRPVDVIADIAPRPLLIIAGAADEVVPPNQSRQLFDAAREPKSWWLIEGATHRDYSDAVGAAYEEKLVGFYDEKLLGTGRTSSLAR